MTNDLHHLSGAYALDALDDEERRAFEAHLAECERCADEVAGFQATVGELADAVAVGPPPSLKASLLAEVAQTRQVPPVVPERVVDLAERRRRRAPRPRLLAAVAAAVVVLVGIASAARLTASDPVEAVLDADDAVTVSLDTVAADPADLGLDAAALEVVWSPALGRAVIVGDGLVDPGQSMAYELWYLADDGSVAPAGLFVPDGGEIDEVLDLDPYDGVPVGWGVTIEPDTGSAQPTGEVLFAGTA
ncbi:MAG: anti-sigma factor [Acidimicrobiales bacterium]